MGGGGYLFYFFSIFISFRWVEGETFPGQRRSEGYSQPVEVQMREHMHENENLTEEEKRKTKTTFFYSDPSQLTSSHPRPTSVLPDHHLVSSVSLLSFASYSHRLGCEWVLYGFDKPREKWNNLRYDDFNCVISFQSSTSSDRLNLDKSKQGFVTFLMKSCSYNQYSSISAT